jgi:hypothetical protein
LSFSDQHQLADKTGFGDPHRHQFKQLHHRSSKSMKTATNIHVELIQIKISVMETAWDCGRFQQTKKTHFPIEPFHPSPFHAIKTNSMASFQHGYCYAVLL